MLPTSSGAPATAATTPGSARRSWAPTATPVEVRGVSPTVPGLYFLGVPFSYAFTSMLVAGAGRDAKYVVDRIAERVAVPLRERGHDDGRGPEVGAAETGPEVALRGPDVADSGRISRLSAACSRTWAVQPAWRASENVAGNRSGVRPTPISTGAA